MPACHIIRVSQGWRCTTHNTAWDDSDNAPPSCDVAEEQSGIRVTSDDHVYSPEPGILVTSVHYETDPKTGKRRVIIGFG